MIEQLYVRKRCRLTLFVLFIFSFFNVVGQIEDVHEKSKHEVRDTYDNLIMLSFGYTFVPQGAALNEHESDGVFVPSIGLDYKRQIGEKWALAIFTDLEMDHYVIYKRELERERAFIAAIGASYELVDHLACFAGIGVEFEKNHNLFLYRVGFEYGIHFGGRWVLVPAVFFDWKETYDTYSFSVGMSYAF